MTTFKLDTSGAVPSTFHEPDYTWDRLSPFVQGYVEAALTELASRLHHLECPSCEWDCIVGPPGIGDLGLMCPMCAEDNGRDVRLRSQPAPFPATVEGSDARKFVRYDRLAPETLARIMEDCAVFFGVGGPWFPVGDYETGKQFWRTRQKGQWAYMCFRPLALYLADDGKVCFTA